MATVPRAGWLLPVVNQHTDYYVAQIALLSDHTNSLSVKHFIGESHFHSQLLPTALFSVGMSGGDRD